MSTLLSHIALTVGSYLSLKSALLLSNLKLMFSLLQTMILACMISSETGIPTPHPKTEIKSTRVVKPLTVSSDLWERRWNAAVLRSKVWKPLSWKFPENNRLRYQQRFSLFFSFFRQSQFCEKYTRAETYPCFPLPFSIFQLPFSLFSFPFSLFGKEFEKMLSQMWTLSKGTIVISITGETHHH